MLGRMQEKGKEMKMENNSIEDRVRIVIKDFEHQTLERIRNDSETGQKEIVGWVEQFLANLKIDLPLSIKGVAVMKCSCGNDDCFFELSVDSIGATLYLSATDHDHIFYLNPNTTVELIRALGETLLIFCKKRA